MLPRKSGWTPFSLPPFELAVILFLMLVFQVHHFVPAFRIVLILFSHTKEIIVFKKLHERLWPHPFSEPRSGMVV